LLCGRDPAGDQNSGAEASDDDGSSTTDGLRDVSDDGSTDGGSDLGIDGTTSGIGFCETLARDEEGGVGILGSVGEVVEESHQLEIAVIRIDCIVILRGRGGKITHDASVDDQFPLSAQNNPGLGCEPGTRNSLARGQRIRGFAHQ
jgi:hypothetical protein